MWRFSKSVPEEIFMKATRWVAGAVCGLCAAAGAAFAADWHVATNGNDAADGMSWATAKQTIQSGVDAAEAGDTVWVADGTYSITYKEKDATLVGENYSSPVKYWMPFNGNIGLHDASWRSSFGGTLYVTGGSHGCVNLPSKKAAEIFAAVEKGEAVIVHGGMTQDQAKAFVHKGKDDASANAASSGASAAAATTGASAAAGTQAQTGSTAAPAAQATTGADTAQ